MKKTIIMTGVVLGIAVAAIWGCYLVLHNVPAQKTAVIRQNGEILYEIDLNAVKEIYRISIPGENESWNVVEISPGAIRMAEASCPDGLCVKQGTITGGYLPIVCLPNHIQIQIMDREGEMYDVQVY